MGSEMCIRDRAERGAQGRADADSDAAGSYAGRAGCTGTVLMLIQMRLEARQAEPGALGRADADSDAAGS